METCARRGMVDVSSTVGKSECDQAARSTLLPNLIYIDNEFKRMLLKSDGVLF
jgi:hypothetical protein